MRYHRYIRACTLAAAHGLTGCSSSPSPTVDAAPETDDSPIAAGAETDASAEAIAYAERLAAAMSGEASGAAGPPDVRWLEPGSPTPEMDLLPPQASVAPEPSSVPETTPAPALDDAVAPASPTEPTPSAPATIDELLTQLLAAIAAGDSPAMVKAIDAATLSLIDRSRPLDRRLLEPLDYEQRSVVERYHQVASLLVRHLGEQQFDRMVIDARLDELFGEQPITIRTIQLCRRVMGYGIYEPFETTTFLAGSGHKAIVYVELDQFRTQEAAEGQFQVKLEQEIVVFNESDGLAVWRSDPVQIVDTSRNRRRDFFVVQMITLPARLTVGRYRLKVRITDQLGGSIDEQTIPLQIVADEALVQG